MNRRLLVLRPEPGASATRARAETEEWTVTTAPLFEIRPCEWQWPEEAFDGLLLTSANAARAITGPPPAAILALPVHAVGEATAEAARAAGFRNVRAGDADGAALLARIVEEGSVRILHLAGREHRELGHPGLTIVRRIVYRADAVDRLPDDARDALADDAITLLHSPRAATLFADLLHRAAMGRSAHSIAAISEAVAAAAGSDWRAVTVAAAPRDDALLAAARRLCE